MNNTKLRQLTDRLYEPVDPYVLGCFRIIFGLFMAYNMIHYFEIGLIRNMFVLPTINFQYDYLRWLKPLPEIYLNIILGAMLACSLAISAGLFFKWACRLFAAGYTYIFLLDKSIYNNHIYLFILLAILLSLTDADQCLSLKNNKRKLHWIPRWQLYILQLQIVIVYFYGGIAKLTYDWIINQQPVRTIVDQFPTESIFGPLLKNGLVIYLLNYGGLFIDLGSPFLLWYKPVRRWAIFLFIGFNLLNSRIFNDIGIFPYAMLFSLLLFYETRELPFINRLLVKNQQHLNWNQRIKDEWNSGISRMTFSILFLYIYFGFQLLFPFRGHFMPNPLDWTTIGNRFSWRMKVDTREIEEMKFYIHSPASIQPVPVDIQTFINDMQILNLSMDPRSIADFSRFLKSEALKYDSVDPKIKAEIRLKYNGRAPQYFVDPDVDLASVQYQTFKPIGWVYPVPR